MTVKAPTHQAKGQLSDIAKAVYLGNGVFLHHRHWTALVRGLLTNSTCRIVSGKRNDSDWLCRYADLAFVFSIRSRCIRESGIQNTA